MSIESNSSQSDRIQQLMKAGNFADEAAVVTAALDLLEQKQRLRALVQEGLDAIERGEVLDHETVFGEVRKKIAAIAARKSQEVMAE